MWFSGGVSKAEVESHNYAWEPSAACIETVEY